MRGLLFCFVFRIFLAIVRDLKTINQNSQPPPWVWVFTRTTQINASHNHQWFIMKDGTQEPPDRRDAQARGVELPCPIWAHHPHRTPTYSPTYARFLTKDAPVTPVTREITRVLGTAHQGLGAETNYVFSICHSSQNKLFLRTSKMFWKKKCNLPALTECHCSVSDKIRTTLLFYVVQ